MVTPISKNPPPVSNNQRAAAPRSADYDNLSDSSIDSFEWQNRLPKKNFVKQSIKGIRRFLKNIPTPGRMRTSTIAAASAAGATKSNGPFMMDFERSDSLFINPTPRERELVLKQLIYPNSIMMSDNTSYRISSQGVSPIPRFGITRLLSQLESVQGPADLTTKNNVTIAFYSDKNHLDDRGEPIGLVKKTIRRGESSNFKNLLNEAFNTFALTGAGNSNVARVKEILILKEESEVVILSEHVEGIGLPVRERVDDNTYFPKSMMTVPDRHPGNYGFHKGVVTHIDFEGATGQPIYAAAQQNRLLMEIAQADGKPIDSRKRPANVVVANQT